MPPLLACVLHSPRPQTSLGRATGSAQMKVKVRRLRVASTFTVCAADIIRLAVLLPMSGSWAVGPTLIGALALAVRDVNDNPDILHGKRLEYVWADDGCDRTKSLLEFTDILGRYRIDGLIGPGCAKGCEVTATLANAKNIAQISPTCAAPSHAPPLRFRTRPNSRCSCARRARTQSGLPPSWR